MPETIPAAAVEPVYRTCKPVLEVPAPTRPTTPAAPHAVSVVVKTAFKSSEKASVETAAFRTSNDFTANVSPSRIAPKFNWEPDTKEGSAFL